MSWFRRKPNKSALPEEQALALLQAGQWACSACGCDHPRGMDLAALAPDPWPFERIYQPNSELTLAGDFLSEDFCVLGGKHFFVRSVLRFPVRGLDWSFGFGCWGTLSRPNFKTYIEHFDDGSYAGLGPWPSWLCNQLLPFMEGITSPVGCDMVPQLNRQRPELFVAQGCDALTEAQEKGLTALEVLDIFACYGHQWRPD